MRIGCIEAGGTKFVVGIGNEMGEILECKTIPTTDPEATFNQVFEFFHDKVIEVLGVGSFGPIHLNHSSHNFGQIMETPKRLWRNVNLLAALKQYFTVPIHLDTDVNVAALGEQRWGAAKGLKNCIYITVGTGIGGGIISEGNLVHGFLHPEIGHMFVQRHENDKFTGICPYHGSCLEGLASGPAITARSGFIEQGLASESAMWNIEAFYLAEAVVNIILMMAPERIILGGGVMNQPDLIHMIRDNVKRLLNGYITAPMIENLQTLIVRPALSDLAGLKGCIALALS